MQKLNMHDGLSGITYKLLLFFLATSTQANSQNIYGFVDDIFCSYNIQTGQKDTVFHFAGEPYINLEFNSAIDRFNGRYFFGGNIPGHEGKFHILDICNHLIKSFPVYPGNIEYDFIRHKLVYEKNGSFYSLDLHTMELTHLGVIENSGGIIYGQIRTYNAYTNKYIYKDDLDGSSQQSDFILIDAHTGDIICSQKSQSQDIGGGFVTNLHNGDIIGYRNGKYGILSPCEGPTTFFKSIPGYNAQLNNQMSVYNHANNTYVVPFSSTDPNNKYKVAIVDIYSDEIVEVKNQPWEGRMNLDQIYDKPKPAIVNLNDTLFVPIGYYYKWFLDSTFLDQTNVNYWVPTQTGIYQAEIEFCEYTSRTAGFEFEMTTATYDDQHASFHLYPNPTRGEVYLKVDDRVLSVQLFDLTGKLIHTMVIKDGYEQEIEINVSHLPGGVYFFKINSDEGTRVEQIVKL